MATHPEALCPEPMSKKEVRTDIVIALNFLSLSSDKDCESVGFKMTVCGFIFLSRCVVGSCDADLFLFCFPVKPQPCVLLPSHDISMPCVGDAAAS